MFILLVHEPQPQSPGHGPLNFEGWELANAGKHAEAIKSFDRQIAQYPNDWSPFEHRAASFAALKQYDKALSDYARAAELTINDGSNETAVRAGIVVERAKIYATLGQVENAVAEADRAVDIARGMAVNAESQTEHFLWERIQICERVGRYREALNDCNELAASGCTFKDAYLARAKARRAVGDLDGARLDEDAALHPHPCPR